MPCKKLRLRLLRCSLQWLSLLNSLTVNHWSNLQVRRYASSSDDVYYQSENEEHMEEEEEEMEDSDEEPKSQSAVSMVHSILRLREGLLEPYWTQKNVRSDGKEVPVDNKFLKSNYPLLLINFYEQNLQYTPA